MEVGGKGSLGSQVLGIAGQILPSWGLLERGPSNSSFPEQNAMDLRRKSSLCNAQKLATESWFGQIDQGEVGFVYLNRIAKILNFPLPRFAKMTQHASSGFLYYLDFIT